LFDDSATAHRLNLATRDRSRRRRRLWRARKITKETTNMTSSMCPLHCNQNHLLAQRFGRGIIGRGMRRKPLGLIPLPDIPLPVSSLFSFDLNHFFALVSALPRCVLSRQPSPFSLISADLAGMREFRALVRHGFYFLMAELGGFRRY
jgi:hypothetical protein